METIISRQQLLQDWLVEECGLVSPTIQAMPFDASFRRYFRILTSKGSFVAMDAPPDLERCDAYVAITKALRAQGLHTPEIIEADLDRGLLLLTDFGNDTYLSVLQAANANDLYMAALDALVVLQACRSVPHWTVPEFGRTWMEQEWAWHKEWFIGKLLALSLHQEEEKLDKCFSLLVASALEQPQVFMHRDFHSANLMRLGNQEVGILDFQDAFKGPLTYDPVSLLRDCYINWPEEKVRQWAIYYWQKWVDTNQFNISQEEFLRWFDWMGVERHLKALFTFARKAIRDQQPHYLRHVPRTIHYLLQACRAYPELLPLYDFLNLKVQPALKRTDRCVP